MRLARRSNKVTALPGLLKLSSCPECGQTEKMIGMWPTITREESISKKGGVCLAPNPKQTTNKTLALCTRTYSENPNGDAYINFVACFVLEIPARSAAVVHRLVVSRICEKRRGRPAGRRFQRRENTKRRVHVLRIESARLAMRAARALRLAARAERYIPPSKARSTFAATPPEAQQGDARRKNALASRKKPSTEEHMMRRKSTTYL